MLWLKLIGGTLVVGAGAAVGMTVAAQYARRPEELRRLQSALQMLETEIAYGGVPLPQALERIAACGGYPVGLICRETAHRLQNGQGHTAAEAWLASVATVYAQTALTDSDAGILNDFGATLGASDRADQLKHLQLAREQLRQAESEAAAASAKNTRMWLYLGFFTGLATLIAII